MIESDSEHEGLEEGVQQQPVEGEHKGFSQKRGFEGDGGDCYRITIELLQELYNWFDIEKQPTTQHGKPLLILIGVHARLSNIDDNGYWIHDEAFEYKGQPVLRKAGTWAHGALKGWVELRKITQLPGQCLRPLR